MNPVYTLMNRFGDSVTIRVSYLDHVPHVSLITEEGDRLIEVFLNESEAHMLAEQLLRIAGIVRGESND